MFNFFYPLIIFGISLSNFKENNSIIEYEKIFFYQFLLMLLMSFVFYLIKKLNLKEYQTTPFHFSYFFVQKDL